MAHSIFTLVIVAVLLYFAIRRVQHRYAGTSLSERFALGRVGQNKEN